LFPIDLDQFSHQLASQCSGFGKVAFRYRHYSSNQLLDRRRRDDGVITMSADLRFARMKICGHNSKQAGQHAEVIYTDPATALTRFLYIVNSGPSDLSGT
jgi:hypothetical protein